mgnify:CR=1 FL=1
MRSDITLCFCGCGQEVKQGNKFIFGHGNRGRTKENDKSVREMAEKKIGRTKENDKSVREMAEKAKKRTKENNEGRRIQAEKHSLWMKNSGSKYISSFKTNESVRKSAEKKIGRTKENDEGVRRASEKLKGKIPHNKGLTKENDESILRGSEKRRGRTKETHEGVRKSAEKRRGRTKETHEYLKRISESMKAGGAIKALKGVKNPSKEELKLRQIVKELYPSSKHTHKIFNYALDIVIEEFRIAIEYDGWFHFCDQDHINYHNKRQKEIEQEGWKFLRYNIFQKFPTLEQLREDIQKILRSKNEKCGL